jgi:hypothetical protein
VDTVIGERVKAESGEEGIVVAVAHAGGDTAGWQLLILQPNLRLATASAHDVQVVPTSEPLSEDEAWMDDRRERGALPDNPSED